MNDAQVRAVELLAQEYDYGWGAVHAHKVADMGTSLFDQLDLHGLLPGLTLDNRRTLMAACYAHDIGSSPRAQAEASALPRWAKALAEPDRHGEMAFHVLRSRITTSPSDRPISTFTPEERSTFLHCLLWHASPAPYVLDIEPMIDRRKALLLAGMLRIADGLDCEHRCRVREIHVQKASVWLRLLVRSFTSATAEVTRAREKANVLSQALNLRIFVQEIIDG